MGTKKILTGVLFLMLAVDIVSANLANIEPISGIRQISTASSNPWININWIDPAASAAGNSEKVAIGFNITKLPIRSPICGLDDTNFRLETLTVPTGGPKSIIHSVVAAGMPPCDYILNVIPEIICKNPGDPKSPAKQLTWVAGVYGVKLSYIKNGKEFADETFNLNIVGATPRQETATISEMSKRIIKPLERSGLSPQPEPPYPPEISSLTPN